MTTDKDIQFIIIDLFCGAGGTTTGFEKAEHENPFFKIAKVVACVNHDPVAIKSHWANHPEVEHFEEDITKLYGFYEHGILLRSPNFNRLLRLVELNRAFHPQAKVILWASLECTNFSKAKGGLPRDNDSRTLADHLSPYITALNPDYIQIENVVEFMSWGPLDKNGKPVSKKNGQDWVRWRESIKQLGYADEWKEMNSADYGALTSRNRLFGCFAKHSLPIVWPAPTHSKNPEKTSLFNQLQKWEPVKKALDFSDEGKSVFNRDKVLSPKTFQRLFMGCVKHIAGGKESFITKWNSNNKKTGGHPGNSIDEPCPVISTQNRLGLVSTDFLINYHHSSSSADINNPAPTITTHDKLGKVQAHFLSKYHGNGENHLSIEGPASTLSTKDRLAKVQATFIDLQFRNGKRNQSVDEPLGAITTVPKSNLVQAEKWLMNTQFNNVGSSLEEPSPVITADRHAHYIINPSWGGNSGSIELPCHVVIARQDKAPLYLITCNDGPVSVPVYDGDCEYTIKLKEFMAMYGISDIKMRMLKEIELLPIQGFPTDYFEIVRKKGIKVTSTNAKKFIGNAVHPTVPDRWIRAFSVKLFPGSYIGKKAA
jgi:DNA (cytosine-5)-methyltransferase 1